MSIHKTNSLFQRKFEWVQYFKIGWNDKIHYSSTQNEECKRVRPFIDKLVRLSDAVDVVIRHFFRMILSLMRGPQPEKVEEKPEEEKTMMLRLPPPPSVETAPESPPPGTVALVDGKEGAAAGEPNAGAAPGSEDPDAASADGAPLAIMSKEGLLASSLSGMDPYEEAAKAAAAAAEVQAQQEAAMADLDAKAAVTDHVEKPPVSSVIFSKHIPLISISQSDSLWW